MNFKFTTKKKEAEKKQKEIIRSGSVFIRFTEV